MGEGGAPTTDISWTGGGNGKAPKGSISGVGDLTEVGRNG